MPTRAQAEQILIAPTRAGAWLALAGVDVSGPSPIAALSDVLAAALDFCGVPPADPTNPTDDDLARLAPADWFKFLDVAEVILLQACAALPRQVTSQQWDTYKVTYESHATSLQAAIKLKQDDARRKWGYGATTVSAGTINLNFAAGCGGPEYGGYGWW